MTIDHNWPAPTGDRLERAQIAWDVHADAIWGERAARFASKVPWVQEVWAQIADEALAGDDVADGAHRAYRKRCELEQRPFVWDLAEQAIWRTVAQHVRDAADS